MGEPPDSRVVHFSGPVSWSLIDKSLEGRMRVYFPHHHLVPKEAVAHARFRSSVLNTKAPGDRRRLWKWCAEDRLFYLNSFVYIFQAKGDPKPVPFNTYPFQDEALLIMHKCMYDGDAPRTAENPNGQEDFRVKKPRDMGVTWEYFIGMVEHGWHFERNRHYLVGSRNKNEVDRGSAAESEDGEQLSEWARLMPKLDFVHLHQPAWMRPPGYLPMREPWRMSMTLRNPANGNVISGESANPNFGRSGRYFGIGFDEFAATDKADDVHAACSSTSYAHAWISTPRGPATEFALIGRSSCQQIDLQWWMHPLHSEGIELDGNGRPTSPWYRDQCERLGNNAVKIAQELNADEEASGGGPFFSALLIENCRAKCRPPLFRVKMDVVTGPDGPVVKQIIDRLGGDWWFWEPLAADGGPPKGVYYLFADVAAGSRDMTSGLGASNSILSAMDARTGVKGWEYAVQGIQPYEFAELAVAAARWFADEDGRGAFLGWDSGGPGDQFGDCVTQKHGYKNVYYDPEPRRREKSRNAKRPGFKKTHGENGNARGFYTDFALALQSGRFHEPNIHTIQEMQCYVHDRNGHAVHAATESPSDPTGARDNHGDRVVASSGLVRMMLKYPVAERLAERIAPPDSFLGLERTLAVERNRGRLVCGRR